MKFIPYTYQLIYCGQKINFDLFVKTSESKVVLLFKGQTEFNSDDESRFKKYYDSKVLYIRQEDLLLVQSEEIEKIKDSLTKNAELNTTSGEKIAKVLFNSEDILTSEDKLNSIVKVANQFINELLKSNKNERIQAVLKIMNDASNNDQNVFVRHANQVGAISTMIALMVENVTLENIVEINLVSVLHGMGLMLMNNQNDEFFNTFANLEEFKDLSSNTDQKIIEKVINKHFDGHNKMTLADNVIFYQHLTLIEINIDFIKIKNIKSQSIIKTIGDFKKILGASGESKQISNPYLSSKILAVGDHLVSLMTFYQKNPSFFEASVKELIRLNSNEKPIHDEVIISKLTKLLS